ncbi:penicillin-binding protein activator [Variibacter gotjawalensis]|nr:penicillin-binding protein activator [Variibacter gotjawalensis]NIK47614.1 ABC-type branched-subunit amino acid transport system substrate-binding protein [Variibacter gotjawalensis]
MISDFNSAPPTGRRAALRALTSTAALALVAGCAGLDLGLQQTPQAPQQAAAPPSQNTTIGGGTVKAALILPLGTGGNAGQAAQAMRNAAELSLEEFGVANVQLIVKDDGGNAQGARAAAEAALSEGAEIILGPLFAQSVQAVGQVARQRNVPVIGFSTDSSVAARGIYLLSFLPETDVDRVVDFAASRGKKSYAALIPQTAYGNVVDAAFRTAVARVGGQIVVSERAPGDGDLGEVAKRVALGVGHADVLFLPGDAEFVVRAGQALAGAGINGKRVQFVGTGLWDDQRISQEATLQGGWFASPDRSGFRGLTSRYRAKYNSDPLRAASLSYDAVSLVAALVKTQGAAKFSDGSLTNTSGFTGVDGVFRFRADGLNERGLAVMRVTPTGPMVTAPAPKTFGSGT